MKITVDPRYRGSYERAVARVYANYINAGAVMKEGQFGQMVFQFPDHYVVGSGLAYSYGPGQWKPIALISDERPPKYGEIRADMETGRLMYWADGGWMPTQSTPSP